MRTTLNIAAIIWFLIPIVTMAQGQAPASKMADPPTTDAKPDQANSSANDNDETEKSIERLYKIAIAKPDRLKLPSFQERLHAIDLIGELGVNSKLAAKRLGDILLLVVPLTESERAESAQAPAPVQNTTPPTVKSKNAPVKPGASNDKHEAPWPQLKAGKKKSKMSTDTPPVEAETNIIFNIFALHRLPSFLFVPVATAENAEKIVEDYEQALFVSHILKAFGKVGQPSKYYLPDISRTIRVDSTLYPVIKHVTTDILAAKATPANPMVQTQKPATQPTAAQTPPTPTTTTTTTTVTMTVVPAPAAASDNTGKQ
ncbi:MAG: hypothetical protein JWM11_7425 [Planctomycetaceae bacterium]|nr:hypothetical protein [Planctomycetaceae bacterium]